MTRRQIGQRCFALIGARQRIVATNTMRVSEKHERTDKALTVSIVSRRVFFGFSWEV